MLKIKRYLKPFLGVLLVAVVLLFAQALSDLNLPNYMSNIVNVGIQQSGIEEATPSAISQEGMKLIQTFMTDEEKALVDDSYVLLSGAATDPQGKPVGERYPKAMDADVYIKKSAEENDALDQVFGTATWAFVQTMQAMRETPDVPDTTQTGEEAEKTETTGMPEIDLAQIYKMQSMLDGIPKDQIAAAHKKALETDAMFRQQTAVGFVKGFYVDLGVDITAMQRNYILRVGLWMLLIALGGGIATVLVSLISSRVAAGAARDLRRDVFNKVESFSSGEFDKYSTASLITRTTNDITQVQMVVQFGIRLICYAPIMAVGGVIMALQKSPSMSWMLGLACVILLGIIFVVFSVAMPKFKALQKLVDRLNLVSRESLSGLMVIRAFGTQKHEKNRFDKANKDLTKTHLFVNRVMVFMMPVMMLIMNGMSILIVWVGAHQISAGAMQVGDMMAFIQYAMQVIMSFLMISMMFIFVPRASVSAERIAEVLDTEISVNDPASPKAFDAAQRGVVEFKNVNFRYEKAEEDVLEGISFVARPGETTALIGATGSGKSTAVNLIMRFYDVTGGQILVDGRDIREVAQKDLRARIGYVPQKGVLLSGTIAENLRYGDAGASDKLVRESAQVAQAADFIEEKPEGYDYEVSQGGTNVSGGQKQRLSIARALVKQPEIFIFDDSFSALDYKTDAALRKALSKRTGQSTTLIVSQRVSTIMKADQILVFDEGKVVGKGTHKDLLQSCPKYYEIASSQLAKEELA